MRLSCSLSGAHCSSSLSAEATVLATIAVRFRRLLFRLWIASIANSGSFSGKHDIPHSVRFNPSRQCQRGLRNGFAQVPYTSPYLLSAPPSCPPVAPFLLVSNERMVGSTLMQLSTLMSSQVLDRVATYSSDAPRYSPFDGTSAEKATAVRGVPF
jgi:hypothetical protein